MSLKFSLYGGAADIGHQPSRTVAQLHTASAAATCSCSQQWQADSIFRASCHIRFSHGCDSVPAVPRSQRPVAERVMETVKSQSRELSLTTATLLVPHLFNSTSEADGIAKCVYGVTADASNAFLQWLTSGALFQSSHFWNKTAYYFNSYFNYFSFILVFTRCENFNFYLCFISVLFISVVPARFILHLLILLYSQGAGKVACSPVAYEIKRCYKSVSYTHLTLPTIYSV